MEKIYISKKALKRIPFYMDYLKKIKLSGVESVSSTTIAKALDLNDVQVRKDLALISKKGGKPKVGYEIDTLINDIESFLGLKKFNPTIFVGAGSLARALISYRGFKDYGIQIIGAFDAEESKIGQVVNGVTIMHVSTLKEFCKKHEVHIAVITVPETAAQKVCDELVEAGVKAIWNFAPTMLVTPPSILVQNENMASSLAVLSRHLNEKMKN